ncbi:MAG: DUF6691 family protein [Rhodothermales bacterium]|nr:DUF6691 family protein [Rhodothermales bacterium]
METIAYQEKKETAESKAVEAAKDGLLKYLVVGVLFGIVLTKSEVISWFRIQEMFRFQAFHMYGVIGGAVAVAALSVYLIKKTHGRSIAGQAISIPPKELGKGYRYWIGGTIFGLGWALTGACPGPIFALIGNGVLVMFVALFGALAGTWTYSALRPHLPH